MSISVGMILFGSLLIMAGFKNVSLSALARGDMTQPKPTPSPTPAAASSSSPAARGKGGHTVGAGGAGSAGGAGGAR